MEPQEEKEKGGKMGRRAWKAMAGCGHGMPWQDVAWAAVSPKLTSQADRHLSFFKVSLD
jgi:hypothetical protein